MSNGAGTSGALRRPLVRSLVIVLLVSVCINSLGLGWGLPNDNTTWAPDALKPVTPMGVAKHLFASPNSGWFYFKYPLGHPLLLLSVQLPYLAWLHVVGQFKDPKGAYPYGFRNPERALTVLALHTRAVSALMGVGLTALAYVIGSTLFGPAAGIASAIFVTGCYPLVYYAHTSNVDLPVLFWIVLALAGAIRAADRADVFSYAWVGGAAAMVLLTKEQGIGALVVLPIIWAWRARSDGTLRRDAVARAVTICGLAFVVVTVVVGAIWWNPMGYANRWRFLFHALPAALREQYAPYQLQTQLPTWSSWSAETARLGQTAALLVSALTLPVAIAAAVGLLWACMRHPRQAVLLVVFVSGFYLISLRAHAVVLVRYTMPVLFAVLLFAGGLVGNVIESLATWKNSLGRWSALCAVSVLLIAALLPGAEVVRLFLRDPRYAAEEWMRIHARPGTRVEVYDRTTYLPRFDRSLQVTSIAVADRTIAAFEQRSPELVVLSSGGKTSRTGGYVSDWEPGKPLLTDARLAHEFFDRLLHGDLGYRVVARFHNETHWVTSSINSLNPEITILAPLTVPAS